ncbi:MAG TPA: fibronectin type III domain-containing protein [Jatrophihabitans sp.]
MARLALRGSLRRRRARHQSSTAGFRPSARVEAAGVPSRTQAVALLGVLVLVAAGITAVSYLIKPAKARSFDLLYGSVYIDDSTSPVAVDLASGRPTVRLANAYTAVSAESPSDIDVYPLGGQNTLLLDPTSGEFNMVDSTGFVIKSSDGGVPLPRSGANGNATAVPSGSSAYILRSTARRTSIYLVSAATVSAAVGAQSGAKARAYATLPSPLSDDAVPAAQANGELWVLGAGVGHTRTITRLSVPTGSNAGVTLESTPEGTVTGPSAVTSATADPDGTGGDIAAVASSDEVRVFRGTQQVTVPVSAGRGVDKILPASNAQGTLVFLYHSAAGWFRVEVPAAAGHSARIDQLSAISPGARLVTPAQSNAQNDAQTYTMDTSGSGALWQIDNQGRAETVPGAAAYPLKAGERPAYGQTQVIADGSRVIFNSRDNLDAEVVFGDGSHPPRRIYKHAAVQVDPSGATALADAHATGRSRHPGKSHKPTKTVKRPPQTINDKIDCKVAKQVPRVPVLIAGDRAARSIELQWLYNRLDPSDCLPSTYYVDIKVLSSDSPTPPRSEVPVQGQTGVTLTHLFPATEYELSVTAYINGLHSTSAPLRVTTGPEGPAAPTDVRADTDSSGNWTVSWNSCGGIKQGCVPSTTWNLIPSFCDGRGLSAVPEKLTFPGDPTVHSFTRTYPGNTSLLGRALCFSVQGVSPQGTIGTTSEQTRPAVSWTAPNPTALTLTASQPGDTTFGSTTTTTVDLDLGANPVRDVGGVGATITLRLTGPDGTKTKTVTWDGRTDRVSTVFPGIRAGAQYTAAASIAAPGHPDSAVTRGPVTVTTRAQWPAISAQASCPPASGAVTLSCTLVVSLSGPSSGQANGERFDVVDSGVVCGNTGFGLAGSNIDPSRDAITRSVDLLQYNGTCTVTVHLAESPGATSTPVFGGTTSPAITRTVDLGHASTLDAGQGDFSAQWDKHDGSSVLIQYTGTKSDNDVAAIAENWQEALYAPDGTFCGSSTQQPTSHGIYLDVNPASCVNDHGDQTGWHTTVSYYDKGTPNQHSYSYTLAGTPPGYVPCTVSASNFAAAWDSTADPNNPTITITFGADGNTNLAGCSNWSYTIIKDVSQTCGSAEPDGGSPASGNNQTTMQVKCETPLGLTWQVRIDYNGPEGPRNGLYTTVQGEPPQPPPPTTDPDPTPTPTAPTPTPSPT